MCPALPRLSAACCVRTRTSSSSVNCVTRKQWKPPSARAETGHWSSPPFTPPAARVPSTVSLTPSPTSSRADPRAALHHAHRGALAGPLPAAGEGHGRRLRVHGGHAGHRQPDSRETRPSVSTRPSRPVRNTACSSSMSTCSICTRKKSSAECIDKSRHPGEMQEKVEGLREGHSAPGRQPGQARWQRRRRARTAPAGKGLTGEGPAAGAVRKSEPRAQRVE